MNKEKYKDTTRKEVLHMRGVQGWMGRDELRVGQTGCWMDSEFISTNKYFCFPWQHFNTCPMERQADIELRWMSGLTYVGISLFTLSHEFNAFFFSFFFFLRIRFFDRD